MIAIMFIAHDDSPFKIIARRQMSALIGRAFAVGFIRRFCAAHDSGIGISLYRQEVA